MKTLISLVLSLFVFNALQAQENKIYGLNFVNSSLQFASLDINDGSVQILSDGAISPDGFQQGVADFDPISKSYFYLQGGGSNLKLFRVDAITGDLISQNTLQNPFNAVAPITNIAYNWLDDKIYGVSHEYNGSDFLRFVSLDPNTGALELVSQTVISTGGYISGNSDIDPINRIYYYATANKIYAVNLDDGSFVQNTISFPDPNQTQFFTNLTYNWADQQLYGLHFLSIPDPDPFDNDYYTSELRLSSIDPTTGIMTIISNFPTSNDGFSQSDCDIDPSNNRYFYIRQNVLYSVELSTGNVLSTTPIENNNAAIAPIINMTYDDLATQPQPLVMDMEEEILINEGESIEINAWRGDDVSYLWSDGSTEAIRNISEAGDYSLQISRGDFIINAQTSLVLSTSTQNFNPDWSFTFYPNPTSDFVFYEIDSPSKIENLEVNILDAQGKLLQNMKEINIIGNIDLSAYPSGTYFLQFKNGGEQINQKIILID